MTSSSPSPTTIMDKSLVYFKDTDQRAKRRQRKAQWTDLKCLRGMTGEPSLSCSKCMGEPPLSLLSTLFLGGSMMDPVPGFRSPLDPPRLLPFPLSSPSSRAGFLCFRSNNRKYITFSVLWLQKGSLPVNFENEGKKARKVRKVKD